MMLVLVYTVYGFSDYLADSHRARPSLYNMYSSIGLSL